MAPAAKKDSQTDPLDVIATYLRQEYRPFALNDLVLNMHSQFSKSVMTKALDELEKRGEIICKAFGKSNIYVYKELTDGFKESDSEVVSLESIDALRSEINELSKDIQMQNAEIGKIKLIKTDLELINGRKALLDEVDKYNRFIKEIEEDPNYQKLELRQEDIVRVQNGISKLEKALKHRKALFKNMIEVIKDSSSDYKSTCTNIGLDMECLEY